MPLNLYNRPPKEATIEALETLLDIPLLTSDLPGCGGVAKSTPEDFIVEEIPLYEPSGEGDHLYLWVEKRDVPANWLIDTLANSFGVDRRDIGVAGQKDRFAVTRQWVSIPMNDANIDDPQQAVRVLRNEDDQRVEVLSARLHTNKLKRGHLSRNRFELIVRDLDGPVENAIAVLSRLQETGVPYVFGPQRFGRGGSTFRMGYDLVKNERMAKSLKKNRRLRDLAINAVQSAIFNRVIARRLADGTFDTAIQGDVLELDAGGLFRATESEVEEAVALVSSGEACPTGPIWGDRMLRATDHADALELDVLREFDLDENGFSKQRKTARGQRRAFRIRLGDLEYEVMDEDEPTIRLAFSLPSGAYATVVLREIMKNDAYNGPTRNA